MPDSHDQRRRVADLFDEAASLYEQASAPLIHYAPAAQAFIAEHAQPGRRVLDLGCGPGRFTSGLPPDVAVVGLDISPAMVEAARRRRPSGTYRVHDFHRALPAALGAFDAILACGCLDFCEDLTRVVGNVAAALAPGGRFHFTVNERRVELPFHGEPWIEATGGRGDIRIFFWTFAETAAAIEAAGLRPLTYRHAPGWENTFPKTTIHCGYWLVERPAAC